MKVVIKIRKPDITDKERQSFDTEFANMKALQNHANIVQLYDSGYAKISDKIGHKSDAHVCGSKQVDGKDEDQMTELDLKFMAFEICDGGELFDHVAHSGPFEEKVARTFIKLAFEALEHCHQRGLAHRDIKCENILLDEDQNLILADFENAALMAGKNGKGYLKSDQSIANGNYFAPEIIEGKPYFGG